MRILITGAGGMLGSAMAPALADAGHVVFPTDLRASTAMEDCAPIDRTLSRNGRGAPRTGTPLGHLDVREPTAIDAWLAWTRPDFVVHLAAETDVDLCEAQPAHAFATNAAGTEYVARACRRDGIPLAYVSTAGVFDGEKTEPYTEDDPAIPINEYGRSKLQGECWTRELVDRSFIVRAGWMVGGGDRDHKFVAKILHQIRAGARVLHAVDDKWGTPTYAPDFARCFAALLETEEYGLYHMACLGSGTRFDVARAILKVLRSDVELRSVPSEFFREEYPAPRPRSEMMRNAHLDRLGLNTMRPWESSLEEYLRTAFPQFACPGERSPDGEPHAGTLGRRV
ncbi:MAG TPA: dTDP-4-dehydrorhamnose reductase [Chloroflexota bacterium]|nr:dTDP-4-dehydrorhamnose reductase [Chloroflexota bacterium]